MELGLVQHRQLLGCLQNGAIEDGLQGFFKVVNIVIQLLQQGKKIGCLHFFFDVEGLLLETRGVDLNAGLDRPDKVDFFWRAYVGGERGGQVRWVTGPLIVQDYYYVVRTYGKPNSDNNIYSKLESGKRLRP